MAIQNFTSSNVNGLFNGNEIDFQTLTESATYGILSVDISAVKDPILVLLDVPSGSGGKTTVSPILNEANGGAQKEAITLQAGKLNAFYITSEGFKRTDGTVRFMVNSTNMAGIATLGIKAAFISHKAVINH